MVERGEKQGKFLQNNSYIYIKEMTLYMSFIAHNYWGKNNSTLILYPGIGHGGATLPILFVKKTIITR